MKFWSFKSNYYEKIGIFNFFVIILKNITCSRGFEGLLPIDLLVGAGEFWAE
jgi:hypothetical protein